MPMPSPENPDFTYVSIYQATKEANSTILGELRTILMSRMETF
jgi:hypothetical protein